MSVRGLDAPTTPPIAFANSSMRTRFSFFWIPRPAETMMSAPDRVVPGVFGQGWVLGQEDVECVSGEAFRELSHTAPEDRNPRGAAESGGKRSPCGDEFRGGRCEAPFEVFRDDEDALHRLTGARSPCLAASARVASPVLPGIP